MPDEIDIDEITKLAAKAAAKASAHYVAETDRGIHKEPIDRQCDDLLAAGYKPVALHPRSPVWITPTGERVPGPGHAWELMKQGERESTRPQSSL